MKTKLSQSRFTLIVSVIFVLFYNFSFFNKLLAVYPANSTYIFFLASLVVVLVCATNFFLSLLRVNRFFKSFFYGVFLFSTLAAYVMDSYGVVIDENMFLNMVKTDTHETLDLITIKLFIYLVLLFVLPTVILYKMNIEEASFKAEWRSRVKSMVLSLFVLFAVALPFGKYYASFLREQKPLRYYTNPTYWIYSIGKFSGHFVGSPNRALESLGLNAIIPARDIDRELIILVVGETARRDRFSINGYKRETNPFLKKEKVVSFQNVTSCGTSTAISVPCMFSNLGRAQFDADKAHSLENLLDVLIHTKDVNVLWRDNNSDSKGVALRVPYEDFKGSDKNFICTPECRDEGMLIGLQEHIEKVKEKDVFIVLHQMGNHGPAYYKRYPEKFEIFKPACHTSELGECSAEEINNAYDNAILYTDYFLSKVIALLKKNSTKFNTGMIYISDHGESLGEHGIYLHGLPYMMAPDEQKNVPLIMWFGGHMEKDMDYNLLKKAANKPYSHDNIFHTVLGTMEVESSVYKSEMDILSGIHIESENK
jgi:lipid A ethanolaminephosphotransferase